jgi:hypothetical protein
MTEKIRLKISPAVARFVRPGVSADDKLSGLVWDSQMEPFDRVTLLFCLARDPEKNVKDAAKTALTALSDDILKEYIQSPDAHPSVLDLLAGTLYSRPLIAQSLVSHKLLSVQVRDFLQQHLLAVAETEAAAVAEDSSEDTIPEDLPDTLPDLIENPPDEEDDLDEGDPAGIDEEDEQYLSKFQVAQVMGISEKIKMALSGDKEWRAILVKDSNKLVSGGVLKNPRITEAEILRILMMGVQNDEIIRLICANREWTKNYRIRKALIDCPKTPLDKSLRYLALLHDKDLARYAKSRNISSVISTQAKRMILAKQKKR